MSSVLRILFKIYVSGGVFSSGNIFPDRLFFALRPVKVATRLTGLRRKTSAVEDLEKTGHSFLLFGLPSPEAEIPFRYLFIS